MNQRNKMTSHPSHTTPESLTIIMETPESQLPTPTAINEITQNETQPTTNSPTNTTPNNVPHPTMELTIDDFPTLTPDEINNHSTDKNDFSNDSTDQSPAITSNHHLQTTFKRPRLPIAKIISTIQHSPKNSATASYMSSKSYTATAPARSTNYNH